MRNVVIFGLLMFFLMIMCSSAHGDSKVRVRYNCGDGTCSRTGYIIEKGDYWTVESLSGNTYEIKESSIIEVKHIPDSKGSSGSSSNTRTKRRNKTWSVDHWGIRIGK